MRTKSLLTFTIALAFGLNAWAQTQVSAGNRPIDPRPDEARIAKQYREQAVRQKEKAEYHEARAEKLMPRGYAPMAHKWPGLANAAANRERSLAIQARRAAAEASRLALEHEKRAQNVAADN